MRTNISKVLLGPMRKVVGAGQAALLSAEGDALVFEAGAKGGSFLCLAGAPINVRCQFVN